MAEMASGGRGGLEASMLSMLSVCQVIALLEAMMQKRKEWKSKFEESVDVLCTENGWPNV